MGSDEGLHIVVVDDSSDDRTLVRREISGEFHGARVTEVSHPEDLERVMEGDDIDIAISDYHLGWGDGLSILRRIRGRWPDCVVVMFTGTGSEEVAVEAMRNGLDDYVVKSAEHLKRLPVAVRRALDHRRQERAIEAVEVRLRGLLDRLPAGIYRSSPEGELLYANPALREILGMPEAGGLSGVDLGSRYEQREQRDEWAAELEETGRSTRECLMRRPDGSSLWVRDRARTVVELDGSLYFEGVLEDITQRKVAEIEAARQADFMALLREVTAVANESGTLAEALPAALTAIRLRTAWPVGHGYVVDEGGEELVSGDVWSVADGVDVSGFQAVTERTGYPLGKGMVGSVWASGEPAWIEDLTVDGTSERAEAAARAGLRAVVAVPVALEGDVVAVLELFASDVRPVDPSLISVLRQTSAELARVAERERALEERVRIEEKMRQAQKMEAIGRLAGGVAHDFNNLLTVITMEARAVLDALEGTGLDPNMPKNILTAAERAAHLTRQLLTFSRGRPTRPTVLSLNAVVSEIERMLDRLIGESVTLESKLGSDAGNVRMDRVELEQLIVNLVVNARDAMPDGGRIVIETSKERAPLSTGREGHAPTTGSADLESGREEVDCVALSVSDDGAGIPEEIIERVVEPFFTTKAAGGTGLGLSICYGVVTDAGGDLRIYSEEGRGTTVLALLPQVVAEAKDASDREEPIEPGVGTVLLVEDDAAVRRVTARVLLSQGYEVLEAGDGEEALEIARSTGAVIDVVVSDVGLPGMRGPEVVQELRRLRPELPALLVSGYSEALLEDKLESSLPGVRLLQKPFSLRDLAVSVRDALDGR